MMTRLRTLAIGVLACAAGIGGVAGEESFKKLSGAQIRTQFTGMQLTDGAHWGETFEPGGRLATEEDRQQKARGTWQVKKDQLCVGFRREVGESCYEVWMSGKQVELRAAGSSEASVAGMLAAARKRR